MRRRELIVAAGAVAVTGCIGGGYDVEAVKSEAESVPYDEMGEGDRIHVERGYVTQVQTDGARYFVAVDQQDGEWVNEIFGSWDGEGFSEGDTVELWGVVEGEIDTDDGDSIPEVAVVDMQVAE
ncbi:MAG: hypothetical protein ACLFSW_00270 [Halobacteriales archaeon]